MAEGVLGAALGGESEGPTEGADVLGAALDPAAAAAAMEAAKSDPALAEKAGYYFDKQARLVEIQTEHLHEQREVVLANLKLKRRIDQLKLCLQAVVTAVTVAIVGVVAVILWQATQARGLVFDGVTTAPSLAARGLTSQSLAENLVARLENVRGVANANSVTRSDEVGSAEAETIKLEAPETGVSLTEASRWLRRVFGHEIHISGAVRDEGDGRVSLVLTTPEGAPIIVPGTTVETDKMLQTGAELAFQRFDPSNYVLYLAGTGREAEAYSAAINNTLLYQPGKTLADAYALLSGMDPDPLRALTRNDVSIHLDPTFMMSWDERAQLEDLLGHDEARLTALRRLAAMKLDDQPRQIQPSYAPEMARARYLLAIALGDYAPLEKGLGITSLTGQLLGQASADAGRHNLAAARRALNVAAASTQPPGAADEADIRWAINVDAGDWPQALRDAQAMVRAAEADLETKPADQRGREAARLATLWRPRQALAQAMTGDLASARAGANASPPDCYFCVQVRGQVAEAAGDLADADRWFTEAVRQAPSLPAAYLAWGEARRARGDLDGAAWAFQEAAKRGPKWADPLKGLGDIAARRGNWREARDDYEKALALAPAWAELKQEQVAAAAHGQ